MPEEPSSHARAQEIQTMFGRIVGRYDLMNRVMSGGRDGHWRALAAQAAVADRDGAIGTGEQDPNDPADAFDRPDFVPSAIFTISAALMVIYFVLPAPLVGGAETAARTLFLG